MNDRDAMVLILQGLLQAGYLPKDHPDWNSGAAAIVKDAKYILDRLKEAESKKTRKGDDGTI